MVLKGALLLLDSGGGRWPPDHEWDEVWWRVRWRWCVPRRSYTRLFCLVLLFVYDLLSVIHIQNYVCVRVHVLQQCWIFLYVVVVHMYKVQKYELVVFRWAYCRSLIEKVTPTLTFVHDTNDALCTTVWKKKKKKKNWHFTDERPLDAP